MKSEEVEVDLQAVLYQLWSHLYILILSAMIGALSLYYISHTLLDKKFQSSTSLYVIQQQDSQTVTYTDLQTGTQLTKDYAELIVSRMVTSQVIADLDLQNVYPDMKDITSGELAEMITVTSQQDTRILKITVEDTNPMRAQDIANAVRDAAAEHIYRVMDIESVNVVDYANLPEGPSSPNVMRNIIIGALIGFILAAALIIVLYLLDDTIMSVDDVQKYLELSVLASIPYDDGEKNASRKRRRDAKKKHRGGEEHAEN